MKIQQIRTRRSKFLFWIKVLSLLAALLVGSNTLSQNIGEKQIGNKALQRTGNNESIYLKNVEIDIDYILAWKSFFLQHQYGIVIVQGKARDGFGHKLLRLYRALATFHGMGVHNISFANFQYKLDIDGLHVQTSQNNTVYCHPTQPPEYTNSLFRSLNLPDANIEDYGIKRYEAFFDALESNRTSIRTKTRMESWLKTLKCEEIIPFEDLYNIPKWENESSLDVNCTISMHGFPPNHSNFHQCEYFYFPLHKIGGVIGPRNDALARQHFQPLVHWINTREADCGFSRDFLDISIQIRLGDKLTARTRRNMLDRTQLTIDSIIEVFSYRRFSENGIRLHIFTETKEDCPRRRRQRRFEELPNLTLPRNFCEKHCIEKQKECSGLRFNATCQNSCQGFQQVMHSMNFKGPNTETIISNFNAKYNEVAEAIHVPVVLHVGNSMQNDLHCLANSDILVVTCSSLAHLAGAFSERVKLIEQQCYTNDMRKDVTYDDSKSILIDLFNPSQINSSFYDSIKSIQSDLQQI